MEGVIIWGILIGVSAGLLKVFTDRIGARQQRVERTTDDDAAISRQDTAPVNVQALAHSIVSEAEAMSRRGIQDSLAVSTREVQRYYQGMLGPGYRVTVGGITKDKQDRRR